MFNWVFFFDDFVFYLRGKQVIKSIKIFKKARKMLDISD